MADPKTDTLEVPGAVLTYDVRQNDASREPVLLLFGSPMGAQGFTTLAGHFPDRTVVTYDPRGAERSKRTDGAAETTPDEHADDLHRLIQALDAGPVDIFASSGGAVNALALVAKHPKQVRTLVAHEPPAAQVLPDRDAGWRPPWTSAGATTRDGFGPAMAKFIAFVSYEGPIPDDYAQRPGPDPATFGLPTTDDGSRDDPLVGQNMVTCIAYEHDVEAFVRRPPGSCSASEPCRRRSSRSRRGGHGRADRDGARDLPRRPRRVPRWRVRRHGRTGCLRGHAARGPRRLMPVDPGSPAGGPPEVITCRQSAGARRAGRRSAEGRSSPRRSS